MDVEFAAEARGDLGEIAMKIARRSPVAAHRYVDKIERRAQQLGELPGTGTPRPEWGADIRVARLGKYLIIHRIRDDAVQILRVLHGARDIDAVLRDEPLPG